MIVKAPTGVSPSFDITIDGAAVYYDSIQSLRLELDEDKHDMLHIEMSGLPPRAVTEYRGRPVLLKVNTGAALSETFTGYVSEVLPRAKSAAGTVNGSPIQSATIVCMGASYRMRGPRSRLWVAAPLETVVDELAAEYGFSYDVPRAGLVYGRIAQEAESDWQFLVRYSRMHGYAVTCHGTHLHVFDPHKAAARNISRHRLTTLADRRAALTPGRIMDFKGVFSDSRSYSNYVVSVQNGGDVYDVQLDQPGALYSQRLAEYVDNHEEAERVLQTSIKGTYDYEAHCQVAGLLGARPGGVVFVDKYNAEYDGLWYVKGVRHDIATGVFTSELHVARNLNSELERVYSLDSFRRPPEPAILNGSWKASKVVRNVY